MAKLFRAEVAVGCSNQIQLVQGYTFHLILLCYLRTCVWLLHPTLTSTLIVFFCNLFVVFLYQLASSTFTYFVHKEKEYRAICKRVLGVLPCKYVC